MPTQPLQTLSLGLLTGTLLLTGACEMFQGTGRDASEPALAIAADQDLREEIAALLQDRGDADQPGVAVLVMVDEQVFYAQGN